MHVASWATLNFSLLRKLFYSG